MRNNEIVRVTFGALDCIKVRHFTQYDRGQVIEFTDLPTVSEVQFRKGDTTVKVLVDQNRVRIPDELLDECGEREAWAIIVNSDSTTTVRKMVLVVHPRTEPSEYIPPEDEPTFREQMAQIMNETKSVAESVRSDADSGKFDGAQGPEGPRGERGYRGDVGPRGDAGADGFSPEAKVERVSDGAEITITDKTGTTRAKVFDGQGGSGGDVTKAYVDQQDTALDQKFTGMYNGAESHISGVSQGLTQFAQAQNKINESKVGFEDYATNTKAGIVQGSGYGINASSDHRLYCAEFTADQYKTLTNLHAIGKGTLESVLNDRIGTIDELIGSGDL